MSRGLAILLVMFAGFSCAVVYSAVHSVAYSADDVVVSRQQSRDPIHSGSGWSGAPRCYPVPHLPNVVQLTDRLFSGGTPGGGNGFDALAGLGVRTVISVDGAMPQVELARAVGIRYVHLPIGYGGIERQRALELTKAVRDLPGPIYVHCHHGRHRAPVAASVAAVALQWLSPSGASRTMRLAGTGAQYSGLRSSVAEARPVSGNELDSLSVEFVESAPVPTLARAMVELERCVASVSESVACADGQSRAEASLLLEEAMIETGRLKQSLVFGSDFQDRLRQSRELAMQLGRSSSAVSSRSLLTQLKQQCSSCHEQHRDH